MPAFMMLKCKIELSSGSKVPPEMNGFEYTVDIINWIRITSLKASGVHWINFSHSL